MTIIIHLRDLIVSLLLHLGLSQGLTVGLADVSLIAIALGLIIVEPTIVVLAIVILIILAYLGNS
jgi:hypothetical protein